jgi:hypothetical protein
MKRLHLERSGLYRKQAVKLVAEPQYGRGYADPVLESKRIAALKILGERWLGHPSRDQASYGEKIAREALATSLRLAALFDRAKDPRSPCIDLTWAHAH